MHNIDGAGHQQGKFVGRDPDTGTAGTAITADWLNAVQAEVGSVIVEAGISLDKRQNNQLVQAIATLIDRKLSQASQGALTEARVVALIKQHAMVWG